MRRLAWVFLVGCGSVASNQLADAPPGDGGSVAPGTVRWVRSLSSLEALGVADGAGGLVVTGAIFTPADFGGPTLTPTGSADLVIAGFNSEDASHLYSVRYGDTGSAFGFMHNVDANGAPIIYGVSYGSVDLGTGKVASGTPGNANPPADGYIGRYGPSKPGWVARMVGTGEDKILATAPAGGNSIYGAGWFESTPTFNGATLPNAGGRDLFLARFNTFTGAVDLTRTYGGTGRDEISAAAAAGNDIVLAGFFDDVTGVPPDALDFHGTAKPLGASGGLDVWVARLDAAGNGIWAVRYGGAGDERDPRVAVDAAGDVYVTGSFTGQVAFGAVNLVALGDTDVFIAKLRGSDGSVAWAVSRGGAMTDRAGDIAVDRAGHVVFGGSVNGTPMAAGDALLESLDAGNGSSRWAKTFATPGSDGATTMTYGRNGDVYAIINLGGTFDFGMPIIGAASPAAVVLRIAP